MINITDVKKVIHSHEEEFIQNLNKVLSYNFLPRTDTVLFEVHSVGYGVFDISITPMSKGEEMAYETIQTLLDEVQFEIDLEQFLDQDDENYRQKRKELNKIAFDLLIPFFIECFGKASNKQSNIKFYLRRHQADEVFDLQNKTWLEIEDLYE
jgi:hypothetical protein